MNGRAPALRNLWAQWFPVIFFWMFQVALTSTADAPTRVQSVEKSVIAWGVWALLTPLIIGADRWLPVSRDALFRRFLFHIPLSVLFTALNLYTDYGITALLYAGDHQLAAPMAGLQEWLKGAFQVRLVVYWLVVFVYITFDYQYHLKAREIRTAELERLLSESRLETLRAQLHPHFLFNTLHMISAHVESTPRTARRMLEELGELLRLSLAHAEDQEIPLADEVGFLEHYLELQKARFDERFAAEVKVDPEALHALVPTFILQPLVENAIRHGMPHRLEKGSLEVQAWRDNGHLHLSVQDDGPGLPHGWNSGASAGTGISNTQERLRRLYGEGDHRFELVSETGKGVRVEVTIPFHGAAAHPSDF